MSNLKSRTFLCENGNEIDVIRSNDIRACHVSNGTYLKRKEKNWNNNFYLTKLESGMYEVSSEKRYSKEFSNFSKALKEFKSVFN